MPSSGPISLGQANTELGRSATATLTMNDSALRTLAGVGGSGTTWGMNSLYGKSAGFTTVSLASLPGFSIAYNDGDYVIQLTLSLYSDGQWFYIENAGGVNSGSWGTPTTTGGGAAYWVRFTRTSFSPVGGSGYSTGTTGWLNLGSNQSVQVYTYADNFQASSATYTIEISTNSSGTNIIATRTGVTISASPNFPP